MQIQKLVFNLFTFLSPLLVQAQEDLVLTGKVIDQKEATTLAYVNIGIIGTNLGTISTANGTFELYLKTNTNEEKIVRFSYLGYESKDYTIASLRLLNGQAIKLNKTGITLKTIEVRPDLLQAKVIGHKKTKTNKVTNFSISKKLNQNLGASIGRRFNIGKKTSQLSEFKFYVGGNNFDTIRFRVNIYTIKNGRPNELLNQQAIITTLINHPKGWATVDLSVYLLFVKEDVVISLEWIEHSQKGRVLQLPITIPSFATHFYKYGSQDKWKRFRGMSTAMVLTVKQ